MPIQPFQIVERELDPDHLEIEVIGELDLAVAGQLLDALERAGRQGKGVLVSLGRCEFIDSTGIAVLVQAYNRLAGQDRALVLHSAAGQVLRTLTISGFGSNGLLRESREDAVSHLRRKPR